jgi:molybdenum cofactor cytidylyltransferase
MGLVVLANSAWLHRGEARRTAPRRRKTPLLEAVDAARASRCCPIVVVIGAWRAGVRDEFDMPDDRDTFRIVVNWSWREGVSTSIRQGLATLEELSEPVAGAVIAPAVSVTTATIDDLLARHESASGPVSAPSDWHHRPESPALFNRALFPELMNLRGPQGLERVVRRHAPRRSPSAYSPAYQPSQHASAHLSLGKRAG